MGKKAVVLSGGGAKGGYQIGAWTALRKIGFYPDIVTGTSVGALNGALMALDKYEDALNIWQNMSMDSVFEKFVNYSDEDNPNHEAYLKILAKDALLNGGADYAPLQELVKGLMDEEALRLSPVRFGLVTTMFPKIKPVEMFIEDIPQGKAADYVLASAAAFPFMKSYKIGDASFVDGGYSDNMPVQMAIDAGAEDIVVVNIGKSPGAKLRESENLNFRYIASKRPLNNQLGGMLLFEAETSRANMRQGELDTYKAFGLLDGYYYSFKRYEKYKITPFEPYCAAKFEHIFSGLPNVSRFEKNGRESILNHLRGYDDRPFEFNSNVLYCAEAAADIFVLDPREVYTMESINSIILEKSKELISDEYGNQIDELSAKLDKGLSIDLLKMVIDNLDKKFITAYCLKMMLKESLSFAEKRRLWVIADIVPQTFCAALFCFASIANERSKGIEISEPTDKERITENEDGNS